MWTVLLDVPEPSVLRGSGHDARRGRPRVASRPQRHVPTFGRCGGVQGRPRPGGWPGPLTSGAQDAGSGGKCGPGRGSGPKAAGVEIKRGPRRWVAALPRGLAPPPGDPGGGSPPPRPFLGSGRGRPTEEGPRGGARAAARPTSRTSGLCGRCFAGGRSTEAAFSHSWGSGNWEARPAGRPGRKDCEAAAERS